VTVLSSDDPVRVYQRFSTLDAVSGGRAEVILGRGSFTESFPLFGYDLADYEKLFDEKLDLFARLLAEGEVTWSGTTRSALHRQLVYPHTAAGLRTWVGVGGNPESVVCAARYGLPLMLAVIGGSPRRFKPLVDLYYHALDQLGRPRLPVGLHSHGHLADSDEEALDQLWPHYEKVQARIGRERGWSPMTRAQFQAAAGPDGALFAGSPDTVAEKVVHVARDLGISRFDLKYSAGTLPHDLMMNSIELFGSKVAPMVREELQG
jgi:alkanesulfonate monooxygenase SsuD/methylene tetrahydromethanopterin reductase-like flavin-dependent oxidoreductase (luciferase family)